MALASVPVAIASATAVCRRSCQRKGVEPVPLGPESGPPLRGVGVAFDRRAEDALVEQLVPDRPALGCRENERVGVAAGGGLG